MERVTATLKRKVGPFTIGVWLIIVVVGVGLGLMIRRRVGGSSNEDSSGSVEPSSVANGQVGLGLGPNTPGAIVSGSAPTTVTRTELVPFLDEEVRDDLFDRIGGIADSVQGIDNRIERIEKRRKVGVDQPVRTPTPTPLPAKPGTKAPPGSSGKASSTTGTRYTVKRGDTLSKIGARFGVAWPTIYNVNRAVIGSNPNLIKPGQVLVIPKS